LKFLTIVDDDEANARCQSVDIMLRVVILAETRRSTRIVTNWAATVAAVAAAAAAVAVAAVCVIH
jgi:hypothetical protein